MELSEYKGLAMRTAKIFPEMKDNLIHAALGLGSECGEFSLTITQVWMKLPFVMENMPEEAGDACWYAALLCSLMDWNFEDLMLDAETASAMSNELAVAVVNKNPPAMTLLLNHFAGEVLTIVKAHAIYGKELDVKMLKQYLQLSMTTTALLCDIHGIGFIEDTLEGNIKKLQKRYPEKYSDSDAIARADKVAG